MKKAVLALFSLAFLLTPFVTHAVVITTEEQQLMDEDVDGQDFTFSLEIDNWIEGTSSTLIISLQGDFNSSGEEISSLMLEGVDFGSFDIDSAEATNVVANSGDFNTYRFDLVFEFDADTTAEYLSDEILEILVDLSSEVTEQFSWWTTENGVREGQAPYVTVSFTYEGTTSDIPEPSAIALLGLGLLGLGLRKKLA